MGPRKPIYYFEDLVKNADGFGIKDYDIFLAHDIDNAEEVKKRLSTYYSIETLCKMMGHRIFVPYRFVKLSGDPDELGPEDTYDLLNEIMIQKTNLFICDLSVNSISIGFMIGAATITKRSTEKKSIIYLCENSADEVTKLEAARVIGTSSVGLPSNIIELIRFSSQEELINKLEKSIRAWDVIKNSENN